MKILNFGSLNIDFVYSVDHIVLPGETTSSRSLQQFPGGKGANQSVAINKAGLEVYHAGKISKSDGWIIDRLEGYGVNSKLIKMYDGPTGHAIIQVTEKGENSIILFGGGNQNIEPSDIDDVLSNFNKNDTLILQNEINNTPDIIKKAHDIGMKICLNPSPFSKEILSWPLDLVNILIVNETEAEGITEQKNSLDEIINTLTKKFPDTEVILTAGENGAYYGFNGQRVYTPSNKVDVIDTTAAGDTFLGYYLTSRLKGLEVLESMTIATKAASITVTKHGAMDSIPYLTEVTD